MKQKWSIDELQTAWELAAQLHHGQEYSGQKEGAQSAYITHIGGVAFEILAAINEEENMDADLAIKCAILHDTVEDTIYTYENVKTTFGEQVANGVMALTKNEQLANKEAMMRDSLERIKKQPKEVWAVKMADRISNLSPPPFYWTKEKKSNYLKEAKLIYNELKAGNEYLANRLQQKIKAYHQYLEK